VLFQGRVSLLYNENPHANNPCPIKILSAVYYHTIATVTTGAWRNWAGGEQGSFVGKNGFVKVMEVQDISFVGSTSEVCCPHSLCMITYKTYALYLRRVTVPVQKTPRN